MAVIKGVSTYRQPVKQQVPDAESVPSDATAVATDRQTPLFDPGRRGGLKGLGAAAGAPASLAEARSLQEMASIINQEGVDTAVAPTQVVAPQVAPVAPVNQRAPEPPKPEVVEAPEIEEVVLTPTERKRAIQDRLDEQLASINQEATSALAKQREISSVRATAQKELADIAFEEKLAAEEQSRLGDQFNRDLLEEKISSVRNIAATEGVSLLAATKRFEAREAEKAKLDPNEQQIFDVISEQATQPGFDPTETFSVAVAEYEKDGIDADDMQKAYNATKALLGSAAADFQQDEFLINVRGMDRDIVEGNRELINTRRIGDSIISGSITDRATTKSHLDKLVSLGRTDLVQPQVGNILASETASSEAKRVALDYLADLEGAGEEKQFITLGNQLYAVNKRTGEAQLAASGKEKPTLQTFGDKLYSFSTDGGLQLLATAPRDKQFQTIGNQVFAFDKTTGESQLVAQGVVQQEFKTLGEQAFRFDPTTGEAVQIAEAPRKRQINVVDGEIFATDPVTGASEKVGESEASKILTEERFIAGQGTPEQREAFEQNTQKLLELKAKHSPEGKDFEQAKFERSVANDLRSDSSEFTKVQEAFQRVNKSSQNATAAGDLSMIFNYMKMLDPGSVVRESEFRSAENAKAWFAENEDMALLMPSWLITALQKADPEQKGAFLLPSQREDFTNVAEQLFTEQLNNQVRRQDQFSDQMVLFGGRKEVLPDLIDPQFSDLITPIEQEIKQEKGATGQTFQEQIAQQAQIESGAITQKFEGSPTTHNVDQDAQGNKFQSHGSFQVNRDFARQFARENGFKNTDPESAEFAAEWDKMAADPGFQAKERAFIVKTHVDPQRNKLANAGFPQEWLNNQKFAEMMFDVAVNMGPNTSVIIDALDGQTFSTMDDVIDLIAEERNRRNQGHPLEAGLKNRVSGVAQEIKNIG